MDKINIIMPCFYSPEVIRPALKALSEQTAIDRFVLTMVDDCSGYNYSDLINEFKDIFSIKLLKTEKNMGPGMARQLGIDNCLEKYILFHDDDDILAHPKVIENFINIIDKYDDVFLIGGGIGYIHPHDPDINLYFSPEENSTIQGKILNNNLIKKYKISFKPEISRFDEDSYFGEIYFLKGILDNIVLKQYYLPKDDISYYRIYNILTHSSISHSLDEAHRKLGFITAQAGVLNENYKDLYKHPDFKKRFINSLSYIKYLLPGLVFSIQKNKKYLNKEECKIVIKSIDTIIEYYNMFSAEVDLCMEKEKNNYFYFAKEVFKLEEEYLNNYSVLNSLLNDIIQ